MPASIKTIEAIFHQALPMSANERTEFLHRVCSGNPDLLREVESLLRHEHQPTSAFDAAIQPIACNVLSTPTIDEDAPAGTLFGPYKIERKLGEGGMGAVYLATDTRLQRRVAVKVISRSLGRSQEAKARFIREARSAAALCHPNIAALHDVGETAEAPWLVMEYVDGLALRAQLSSPLKQDIWIAYAQQIAAALEHAHNRGLVHRDIKPENIFIGSEGQLKVIDFGLARAFHEEAEGSSNITRPSSFVGTLAYAAPEIITGGAASPRSDVYSTGVLLYEMATGRHPFAQLTGHALVSAILVGSFTPCRDSNSNIAPWMEQILDQCMSREPAARFRNGGELLEAIRQRTAGPQVQPAQKAPTLAILDFRSLGGAMGFAWLGSGIAETLSADLAKIKSVRVASRGRVVQTLKRLGAASDDATAAMDLGRELGARWVVTGSYQQMGDRIRVTAGLVHTGTGDTVAAEKVDGKWDDLFQVQDRVVESLLRALTIDYDTSDEQKILPAETRNMAAYENYVRGRQQMYEMQSKSLSSAIHLFEQSVALDSRYALAYSALGTAHALQFIRTGNPEDISKASRYLERATELDPELGEPYPWLTNIRVRKNDPAGAFAAAEKGLELQPDLPESHYFFSGAHYLLPEWQPGSVRKTPQHLVHAIHLQPRLHVAWLVLGATVTFLGRYEEAITILNEAVRMETEPDLIYRFVGARTLLAFAHFRIGAWDVAREQHRMALDALRDSGHVYTTSFQILSACGLGDLELRCGNPSAALAHYRHGHRILREAPRTIGATRLEIRVNTGLASGYAVMGDLQRAKQLTVKAAEELDSIAAQTASANFDCSLAQLWLDLAATSVRLEDLARAASWLVRARENGWMDSARLAADQQLQLLRDMPEYLAFVDALASYPPLDLPMPSIPSGGRAAVR